MSKMKTVMFPGDTERREVVDAAAVHYTEQQNLTEEQQATARANIGVFGLLNTIYYSKLSTAINDLNAGVTNNGSTSADNALVKVSVSGGRFTVTLLANVSEEAKIEVNRSIDLNLAGHTLEFIDKIGAYLYFGAGTSCSINGEVANSSIVKKLEDYSNQISSGESSINLIRTEGDSLQIKGGSYSMTYNSDIATRFLSASDKCNLFEISDCELSCTNLLDSFTSGTSKNLICIFTAAKKFVLDSVKMSATSITSTYGVQNSSTDCYIKNCDIHLVLKPNCGINNDIDITNPDNSRFFDENQKFGHTESNDTSALGISPSLYSKNLYIEDSILIIDAPGSDSATECSNGIRTAWFNTCYVNNTKIYATHSGITGSGSLYVRNSILSGLSHGGIYVTSNSYTEAQENGFTGKEEEWAEFVASLTLYIKDTTLQNDYYPDRGVYNHDVVSKHGGLQNNCYIGNYYDDLGYGRDVYMDGCEFLGSGPCVRYSLHSPNRLFVSNTTFPEDSTIRVMSGNIDNNELPGELKIGVNCNITPDNVLTSDGSPDNAELTNELYRMYYRGEVLTESDLKFSNFGGGEDMTVVNEKLDTLMRNFIFQDTFHLENDSYALDADELQEGSDTISHTIEGVPSGAKLVIFEADDNTLTDIKSQTDGRYYISSGAFQFTPAVQSSDGARVGCVAMWKGNNETLANATVSAYGGENGGLTFKGRSMKAGKYNWTAYYWDDQI